MASDKKPMQQRPETAATGVTAASSGFRLPMPSPELPQEEGLNDQYAHEQPHQQPHYHQGPPSGFTSSDIPKDEADSGMFSYDPSSPRPGTRGGDSSHAYSSSFFANPRLHTGIANSHGSPAIGYQTRPLTAFTIPEEHATELHDMSDAAAYAAAYRDGKATHYNRNSVIGTPIIELDGHMRDAARAGDEGSDEPSTPAASGKTDYDAFLAKEAGIEPNIYDNMDPDELMKLAANMDLLGEHGMSLPDEEEDSPYPEVRASVSNYDDPDMPCLTFRAMFLGVLFTVIGAALNAYFQMRYPAPLLTPVVVQVITYPFGKLMARCLPTTSFTTPSWLRKIGMASEWSFNPGPFNIKEHTVIIIMANVGIAPPFALNLILALDKYYSLPVRIGFDILILLSTQVVGFSFAGLCRRFLIWPAAMIWPQTLVTCTLLNTFHAEDDDPAKGGLTRYRYFLYVFAGALAWYFLPGFLFVALSAFSWVCWIAPTNPVVNQLFGVASGLGMSCLTFDWSQIAYTGSPLIVPWWAIVNVFTGFVILYWVFSPIMYYTNTWDLAYLPISVNGIFDRFGSEYNVSAILNPDITLNLEAYAQYSPLYFPSTYVTVYALAFALATASLVHTALYNGPEMWATFRDIKKAQTDIHAKLMLAYKEVPSWWYCATFAAFTAMVIALIEVYDTKLPVWGVAISLLLAAIYIIPGGFIYAWSAQTITINIIAELIPGYAFEGRPIANMVFKAISVQSLTNGIYFVQDLKLGHYMKVPPRVSFAVQIAAVCIAAFIQVGVKEGLTRSISDLCSEQQANHLTCPSARSQFNTSVIWGLIGPARMFGQGSPYVHLYWALLVGAALPAVFFLLSRRFRGIAWLQLVNFPVMLSGASLIPPATGINYSSWFLVGFIFQYMMRRYRFRWWSKFCFITSAALDSGTVISTILVFLLLQLPKDGTIKLNWWGNNVFRNTYDWLGYPFKIPPPDGFGRSTWS